MRSHVMQGCGKLAALMVLFLSHGVFGQNAGQIEAAQAILSAVAPADVPARCADLVAGAPVAEQAAVAASLVPAVIKQHPAALSASLVGMSARVPRIAPAVAAAAVEADPAGAARIVATLGMVPGVLKSDILVAAIGAAPAQAGGCLVAQTAPRSRRNQRMEPKPVAMIPNPSVHF
jgi:hypothetical protein